jgi:hypothetical protein
MGKYTVTAGQNIFDVALHIYGSIEGITDLMMNNAKLSLAQKFKAGDTLEYSDGFVINPDIVSHYRMNGIVPANGERGVYFKKPSFPKALAVFMDGKRTSATFGVSGVGTMEIDWGDNSPLQSVLLSNQLQDISYGFDNAVSGRRKITLYGNFTLTKADFTGFQADSIILFRPVAVEKLLLKNAKLDIAFLSLMPDIYELTLHGLKTASLLPLLSLKNLMKLDLSEAGISVETLDEYLIALVKKHYGRRNCTVTLTQYPSGEYHEPERDGNGDYIIASGMEAVWLLCNEPAWNEAGYWKFIINEKVYTSEIH